jgi:hypothetical protein
MICMADQVSKDTKNWQVIGNSQDQEESPQVTLSNLADWESVLEPKAPAQGELNWLERHSLAKQEKIIFILTDKLLKYRNKPNCTYYKVKQ